MDAVVDADTHDEWDRGEIDRVERDLERAHGAEGPGDRDRQHRERRDDARGVSERDEERDGDEHRDDREEHGGVVAW